MVTKVKNLRQNQPWSSQFERNPETTTGTILGFHAGFIAGNGTQNNFVAGTIQTVGNPWLVYIDLDDSLMKSAALASAPTDNIIPLYSGESTGGVLSNLEDLRSWTMFAVPGPNLWDERMTALDPDVWYKFDETSGNILNQGSFVATNLDLAVGNQPIKGALGPVTPVPAASSASFRTIAQTVSTPLKTTDNLGLGDLNGGAPANTGTFICVFRAEYQADQRMTIFGAGQGFDLDEISVQIMESGRDFRFHLQDDTGNNDEINFTLTPTQMEVISSEAADGNWHMAAIVSTGTEILVYYDGTDVTNTATKVVGSSITEGYWVNDFRANDDIIIGNGRISNTSAHELHGDIDEWAYFDGTQVSAANIALLWDDISSRVGASVRGARESLFYATNKAFGYTDAPLIHIASHWRHAALLEESGRQTPEFTSVIEDFTDPGDFGELGWNNNSSTFDVENSAYSVGNGVSMVGNINNMGIENDTTGWLGFMFRPESVLTYTADIFSFTNGNDTVEAGEARLQYTPAGSIHWTSFDGAQNINVFITLGSATGDQAVDIYDGAWHQFITYQDGVSMVFYIDGVLHTIDDAHVAISSTGVWAPRTQWWNDWTTLTGTQRMTFGGFGGPQVRFGTDGSFGQLMIDDGVMTQAIATRMWNATGLA